jgi:transposase
LLYETVRDCAKLYETVRTCTKIAQTVSRPEIGLHINSKQMDKKTVAQIIQDRAVHGLSYRSLAKKYNFAHSSIYYMLKKKPKKEAKLPALEIAPAESLTDDINILKEELRKARLMIELQDLMLDISSKELGIDLRKKHGTRQSK